MTCIIHGTPLMYDNDLRGFVSDVKKRRYVIGYLPEIQQVKKMN